MKINLALITIITIALSFTTAMADMKKSTQTGVGTIDTFESHGKLLYRFVPKAPNKEKLRKVKMHTARMGYRKGLPKEIEAFFAKALADKSKIKFDLDQHIKEFENKKLVIENQENQKLTALK